MVYTSNPNEGKSTFTEGCPEGVARGTTRGKGWLSWVWVGSITFFLIYNFLVGEGLEKPSLCVREGLEKPALFVREGLLKSFSFQKLSMKYHLTENK